MREFKASPGCDMDPSETLLERMPAQQLRFLRGKHTAAIKNEARNGVSPIVVKGWNCDITRRSSATAARLFARAPQLQHGDVLQ